MIRWVITTKPIIDSNTINAPCQEEYLDKIKKTDRKNLFEEAEQQIECVLRSAEELFVNERINRPKEYSLLTEKESNCPFGCPKRVQEPAAPPRIEKKGPQKKSIKFYQLGKSIENGKIPNNILVDAYKIQLASAPILFSYGEGGVSTPWRGKVRGSKDYSWVRRTKIAMYCNEIDKIEGTSLFVTLTIDQKRLGNDMSRAWTEVQKEIKHTLRALKGKHDVVTLIAVEAHESGWPHLHLICKVRNQKIRHYIDKKGKWRPCDPYWRSLMRSVWRMGHIDVQVVKDNRLAGYVSKYICKSYDPKELDNVDWTSDKGREIRKSLASTMLPIYFGRHNTYICREIRQIVATKIKNAVREIEDKADAEYYDTLKGLPAPLALMSILNYRTQLCQRKVYLIGRVLRKILYPDGEIRELPPDFMRCEELQGLIRRVNCYNCSWIDFLKKKTEEIRKKYERKEKKIWDS